MSNDQVSDDSSRIDEIFWPHPYSRSAMPNQVAISNGVGGDAKVFVVPYSIFKTAILKLLADARREGAIEELQNFKPVEGANYTGAGIKEVIDIRLAFLKRKDGDAAH